MLSRRMSLSKRVPQLTIKSQLIFTWIIAWLDDYGCFTADPEEVKSLVFPRNKKVSENDIATAVKEMVCVNLVNLYQKDDDWFLQYTNFNKFQTFRSDRPKISEYPQFKDRDKLVHTSGIPPAYHWQTQVKVKSKLILSSKEDREGKPSKTSFGNNEINETIKTFKKLTGLEELGENLTKTRQFGWNLTRKYSMKQIQEAIEWLLEDDFWKDNLTKLSQLYYQMPRWKRENDIIVEKVKPK